MHGGIQNFSGYILKRKNESRKPENRVCRNNFVRPKSHCRMAIQEGKTILQRPAQSSRGELLLKLADDSSNLTEDIESVQVLFQFLNLLNRKTSTGILINSLSNSLRALLANYGARLFAAVWPWPLRIANAWLRHPIPFRPLGPQLIHRLTRVYFAVVLYKEDCRLRLRKCAPLLQYVCQRARTDKVSACA